MLRYVALVHDPCSEEAPWWHVEDLPGVSLSRDPLPYFFSAEPHPPLELWTSEVSSSSRPSSPLSFSRFPARITGAGKKKGPGPSDLRSTTLFESPSLLISAVRSSSGDREPVRQRARCDRAGPVRPRGPSPNPAVSACFPFILISCHFSSKSIFKLLIICGKSKLLK